MTKLSMKKENELTLEMAERFELYPENKRRTINKILFRNDYFHLIYSFNENTMDIMSKRDLLYSAIPYDTCRKYIQRATI